MELAKNIAIELWCGFAITLFLTLIELFILPLMRKAKEGIENKGDNAGSLLTALCEIETKTIAFVIVFIWSIIGFAVCEEITANIVVNDVIESVETDANENECSCQCDACLSGNCADCKAKIDGVCECCPDETECDNCSEDTECNACSCGCGGNEEDTEAESHEIDEATGMENWEAEEYKTITEEWNEPVKEVTVPQMTEEPVHYVSISKYKAETNEYGGHELIENNCYLYSGTRSDFMKSVCDRDIDLGLNLAEGSNSAVYMDGKYTVVCLYDEEGNEYVDFFYIEGDDYLMAYEFH